MKDKLHRALIDATHNVFELMFNISELSDHPIDNFKYDDEVNIAIGIVGDLEGVVIYRFPTSTSLNMVKIMSGMEFEEVDAFVTSAISEIANIISGNVVTALSNDDIKCEILPPVQCEKHGEKEFEIETSRCIGTAIGDICLDVRLNRAS